MCCIRLTTVIPEDLVANGMPLIKSIIIIIVILYFHSHTGHHSSRRRGTNERRSGRNGCDQPRRGRAYGRRGGAKSQWRVSQSHIPQKKLHLTPEIAEYYLKDTFVAGLKFSEISILPNFR